MYCYGDGVRYEDLSVELSQHPDVRHVQAHSPVELRPLFQKLEDWMRLLGYPRVDIFATNLALFEVATNAFRHGNKGDSDKQVRVRYLVTPAEVLLEVEDEGGGFDPSLVPHPLANGSVSRYPKRGLFLARAYASWMSFNPSGNRVTLCRHRSVPSPSDVPVTPLDLN
jgi:serine/threonine-protein kinase RsbW